MSLTKQRTIQYIGLIAIFLAMAAGYWYWQARASRLNAPQTGMLTNGLVAYWPFNGPDVVSGTFYDRSGSGYNGSVGGGAGVRPGKVGQALFIDTAGDYVYMGNPVNLDFTGSFSISAWINPSTFGGSSLGRILDKQYNDGVTGYAFYVDNSNTTNGLGFCIDGCTSYGSDLSYSNANVVETGVWQHVAVTFDGASLRFYKNGVAVGGSSLSAPSSSLNDLYVGDRSALNTTFDGLIDELRMYSRTLAAGEIQSLYDLGNADKINSSINQNQGTGRLDSGLGLYWKMDEGTSTTVSDGSTNGLTGTLTNGSTWATGQIGSAVDLDGTDDYVTAADSDALDFADGRDFTLSGWFNRDTFTTDDSVLAKSNGQTAADTGYNVYIDDTTDKLTFVANDGTDQYKLESVSTFTATGWHHFVISWGDNSSLATSLFIDGAKENATATGTFSSVGSLANAVAIRAGAESDAGNPFDGKLDEIRIYQRALSSDEVAQLYRLTSPTGVDTGLKGYWSFNGADVSGTTAFDRSGAGNTGTLTNGPTVVRGKFGQALSLDGTNDHVTMGDAASLKLTGALTISAWIYPETMGGANLGRIFDKNSSTTAGYMFYLQGSSLTRGLTYLQDAGTAGLFVNSNSYVITLNAWQHVAVTIDANKVATIYVNGTIAGSTTLSAFPTSGTNNAVIGGRTTDNARNFDGMIDDLRVYNRALSASEIQNQVNTGQFGKINSSASTPQGTGRIDSGLVGYWKLDDGSGTNAADTSINGNNGTLTSGPTWTTGQVGGAVDFDGTDDYITLGSGLPGLTNQSIAAWIRPDNVTGFHEILVRDSGGGFTTQLMTNGDEFRWDHSGGVAYHDTLNANLQIGTWYHIVLTYSVSSTGNNVAMYVNGQQQDLTNSSETATPSTTQHPMYIGKDSAGSYFDGIIDEVRVYDRALSLQEAKQLYNLTSPTSVDTNLRGYWSFNGQDISGTTAYDRSGASNEATLTNGPTVTPGKLGQALSFDGSNDYVDAGDIAAIDSATALTACAWVRHSTITGDDDILKKMDSFGNQGWQLQRDDTASVSGRTDTYTISIADSADTDTARVEGATNASPSGTWTHTCFTFQASSATGLRLYINGTEDANSPVSTSSIAAIDAGANNLQMSNTVNPFIGAIDEARIYTRVLTAAEIAALYNSSR